MHPPIPPEKQVPGYDYPAGGQPINQPQINQNFNRLVMGALAVFGIVIVAMAISANSTGAKIIQWGLAIAILGVLLRESSVVTTAWNHVIQQAIGVTQKQTGS